MSKALLLLFCLGGIVAEAQEIKLSPNTRVSVITCGPTQLELYSAFGHSAIRVQDPANGIDYAYNYGVFDFDQPNFYLNYTKGLLLFKLGVYPYSDFRDYYIYFNRSVTEQYVDITQSQKQKLFDFLEWNAKPENQTYRYDYFYNNCASKVRDVFRHVLRDSIQFDSTFIQTKYTIRQLTDLYLTEQPWGDLGIDICLGLPIDKQAKPYEYMFLPDYIESSFDHATVLGKSGWKPAVIAKVPVYHHRPEPQAFNWFHPWIVLGFLFAIAAVISFIDWKRKKLSKWFDLIFFFVLGAVGVLLLLLWTMTDHRAAANNMNLLWALPSHLIVLAIYSSKATAFIRKYFTFSMYLTAFLLAGWVLLPQQLNLFLIPVVGVALMRSILLRRLI